MNSNEHLCHHHKPRTAEEAIALLKEGNAAYMSSHVNTGNISNELIRHLFDDGQRPYAIIITCADSRVAPEHIFMTGLGELFVIRVAGNVLGPMELGSALYAAEHLQVKLLVVMGHTHCGAIESALDHTFGDDHTLYPLLTAVNEGICGERDPELAAAHNARFQVEKLKQVPELAHLCEKEGLQIIPTLYHTYSGRVEWLE